jgi:hypothetical protein
MNIVWIGDNNKGTIICPKCAVAHNIDATKFQNTKKELKAKCKCSEIFPLTIEFRRQFRKNVRLPGEYNIKGKKEKGEIIIKDLSLSGIKFESFRPNQISADDMLEVKFNLDSPSKKEIRKEVKVIWVDNRIVGAQFTERTLYKKDLGFYLNF